MSESGPAERLNTALSDRYRIERELGEGGMATVYLAEDLKHERQVAIKVLKPELAAVVGAERFLAEIRTTASLQHPHILPLHDSGEADGFIFYVMPYVGGESLRERLERERQLPVEEALEIARDVADALDYAHRQGVVHRDIKPANILLHEGRPQLADFGIALAVAEAGEGRLTETGLSLGTPHYMSPEQAAGERTVDARTDVYALACVLYEMLAGEPPFAAPTAQAVLARILTTDPAPVTSARRTVPPNVEAALAKALEKLPADRFGSAKAFGEALDDPSFRHTVRSSRAVRDGEAPPGATAAAGPKSISRTRVGLAAGATAAVALAAGWMIGSIGADQSGPQPVLRVPVDMGDLELTVRPRGITLSPDGRTMAVAARGSDGFQAIRVRRSHESVFRALPGTEGGAHPAFSPEGGRLVFRNGEGGLSKVALDGGSPTTVLAASLNLNPVDPYWGDDGTIVFTGAGGLYEVSENGGDPTHLVEGENVFFLRSRRLPGRRAIVGAGIGDEGVWLYEPSVDSVRTLIPEGQDPTYLEPGYLVYRHVEGGLWAAPFDLDALELTGPARPVLDEVTGPYSVSDNGTLVYSTGNALNRDRILLVLAPLDGGPLDTLPVAPRNMAGGTFSPDGGKLAFWVLEESRWDVYTYDMVLGGPTRFTFARPFNHSPVWSPDGTRLAFSASDTRTGGADVWVKPLDGSAEPTPLIQGDEYETLEDWTEDGRLFYRTGFAETDIRTRPVDDPAADQPVLAAEWEEAYATLSPDGGWLAYTSDETGRGEIYVRRFPELTGQQRVSEGGGVAPRWSPEGDVLYYSAREGAAVVAARVRLEPSFAVLEQEVVYDGPLLRFDVHPTEPRLLVMTSAPMARAGGGSEGHEGAQLFIVTNWFTELRERLGEGR